MKAQQSLEFLFLSVLSLAIIVLIGKVLIHYYHIYSKLINQHTTSSTTSQLYAKAHEVCALGNGYSLPITIQTSLQIECVQRKWKIKSTSKTAEFSLPCPCYPVQLSPGEYEIKNLGGTIYIS